MDRDEQIRRIQADIVQAEIENGRTHNRRTKRKLRNLRNELANLNYTSFDSHYNNNVSITTHEIHDEDTMNDTDKMFNTRCNILESKSYFQFKFYFCLLFVVLHDNLNFI